MSRFFAPLFAIALLLAACSGPPPNIKVTDRPANGLTEAAMDSAWLKRLAKWTVDTAQARLIEAYRKNNVPPTRRSSHPFVHSALRTLHGRRLAVLELGYSGTPERVTRVVGLRGDRLVTVSCTAPYGKPIDIADRGSDCGQQVAAIFLSGG